MKAVKINRGLLLTIRGKSKGDRQAIGWAIRNAQLHFGDPHSHRGTGIRKLSAKYYELRVGLDYRLIFTDELTFLRFVEAGSHAQVKRFLKQHP